MAIGLVKGAVRRQAKYLKELQLSIEAISSAQRSLEMTKGFKSWMLSEKSGP